ncbi:MAG: hypothetical protein ABIC95_00230 [archaeon]
MKLSHTFSKSFDILKKRKGLVIPVLVSVLLPLIIVTAFIMSSGFTDFAAEMARLTNDYDSIRQDQLMQTNISDTGEILSAMEFLGKSDGYEEGLWAYAIEQGIDPQALLTLLSMQNLALLFSFIALWIVLGWYVSSAIHGATSLAVRGRPVTFSSVTAIAALFLLRLLALSILTALIFLVPIVIVVLIGFLLFTTVPIVGVLFSLIAALAIFAYLVFLGVLLIFAPAIMYIDDVSATVAIRRSFRIAKRNLGKAFLIMIVVWSISWVAGQFINTPLGEVYWDMLFPEASFHIIFSMPIFLVLVVLQAVIFAYINLFMFQAYADIKMDEKAKKR